MQEQRTAFDHAIQRTFGSRDTLRRAFLSALHRSHGGHVWLVCLRNGALRLFVTPRREPPCPAVLLHSTAPQSGAEEEAFELRWRVLDLRRCAARYDAQNTPTPPDPF